AAPTPASDGGGGGPPDAPDGPDILAIAPERPPLPSDEDIRRGAMAGLKDATDLSNCVLPLLEALNWRGDPRHVAEALPHFINNIDITAFRNILATLHYESRPIKIRVGEVDPRLMPCVFLPEDGGALVLFSRSQQNIQAFDGERDDFVSVPASKRQGMAYFFTPVEAEDMISAQQKVGWFRAVTERFRSLFYQTLGITLILNLLALATPLFVMAVYDKVVATGSIPTLAYFAVGVGIAIACDLILRSVRSKIMAFVGARLDNIVGLAIFHKILFLPPSLTERSTVGAQVARIKDFETIRDFFTGPMALTLLEVPFAFIFLAVIISLAGPLVWIPVIMVALYGILALVFTPLIRATVSRAARASSRRQELVVETLNNMRAVKYCGAEATWLDRYRDLSSKSALNSFYTSQLSSIVQTLSHVLMVGSGVGTIVFGVFRVLEGEMTVGSLVATMMLVWRVLGPLQTGFISMSRITQVRASIGQINNLMNIRAEREQHTQTTPLKRFDGFVSFARVSIRYSPEADPALVGVSFEVEPGEVICVVGGNGSGKSTVLKLLAGMYQAQAGSIRIDNMDIRQMDTVELRHAVGYVPQSLEFFYGTIAQNLRLAHPTATDDDLRWACHKAGVLEDVLALEQGSGKWQRTGFEVRIGDTGVSSMPTSMLQRLNLARGYLKQAPVMLFDEPGNGLDFEGDQTFMRMVDEMRGEQTVLIVTHRPSHLRIADKILWLEYGNVRAYGPAQDVLKEMPKDFL
ncbi:MAG: ATP-binding cassette domain-containing protein, partial [Rhodospirillaceae bacterium]|nr:ATP-binding cassette domain-containing protein [Rhodospirillaceae bacterium]